MTLKKLPIGVEDFPTMCQNGYYYVDKTGMIAELLKNLGTVNLFARPRRFGKSLNMSMLKYFFEIGTDKTLFEGLEISKEQDLCAEHMGKYPVISLSLKEVKGLSFEEAMRSFYGLIRREVSRFDYLQKSDVLSSRDKTMMMNISLGQITMGIEEAVLEMSKILYNAYQEKVVILIDEYDVPLQKAEEEHYYREMVSVISKFFGSSMKTNPYMAFAVVTGCLCISKESIFTGFNNPKIHTIADERYAEWFGFTDEEVREMLAYYDRSEYFELTKEWYDGYLFGKEHVYCPWDVINWCDKIAKTSDRFPENYWANTSGNSLIRRFADIADEETKEEMEILLAGGTITKQLNMEITYDELDDSIEHIWSVLFMTGYLTFTGRDEEGAFMLRIPNKEIAKLFRNIFEKWFKDKVLKDEFGLGEFFKALDGADALRMEECINYYLEESISYLDGGKLEEKESFYHGMLLGILKSRAGWAVRSNREAGRGRLDIATYLKLGRRGAFFELKYAKNEEELEAAAGEALKQIEEKGYDSYFKGKIMEQLDHYGIAFCKKRCVVVKG